MNNSTNGLVVWPIYRANRLNYLSVKNDSPVHGRGLPSLGTRHCWGAGGSGSRSDLAMLTVEAAHKEWSSEGFTYGDAP